MKYLYREMRKRHYDKASYWPLEQCIEEYRPEILPKRMFQSIFTVEGFF